MIRHNHLKYSLRNIFVIYYTMALQLCDSIAAAGGHNPSYPTKSIHKLSSIHNSVNNS